MLMIHVLPLIRDTYIALHMAYSSDRARIWIGNSRLFDPPFTTVSFFFSERRFDSKYRLGFESAYYLVKQKRLTSNLYHIVNVNIGSILTRKMATSFCVSNQFFSLALVVPTRLILKCQKKNAMNFAPLIVPLYACWVFSSMSHNHSWGFSARFHTYATVFWKTMDSQDSRIIPKNLWESRHHTNASNYNSSYQYSS